MSEYVITLRARQDIYRLWSYIAEDNEDAANRVEGAVYDACALVAEMPLSGVLRPDLTNRTLRFWILPQFPNYVIVYRPETVPLEIIAVLHGRRNLRRVLNDRP